MRGIVVAAACAAVGCAGGAIAAPSSMLGCMPKPEAAAAGPTDPLSKFTGWISAPFRAKPEGAANAAWPPNGIAGVQAPQVMAPSGPRAGGWTTAPQIPASPQASALTRPQPNAGGSSVGMMAAQSLGPAATTPTRAPSAPTAPDWPTTVQQSTQNQPASGALDAAASPSAMAVARSQAAEARGEVQKARALLDEHLATATDDVAAMRERAHLEDRQEQLAEAERWYRRAVGTDPTEAGLVNDLALCLARQGRFDESEAMLRHAIVMRPDKALYRNNLATVLVEVGRSNDAHAELAATSDPAQASYNLGLLLARSGDAESAAAWMEDALRADPTLAAAQEALARLRPAGSGGMAPASRVAQAAPTGSWGEASETTPLAHTPPMAAAPPMAPAPSMAETAALPEPAAAAPSFPRLLPPVVQR